MTVPELKEYILKHMTAEEALTKLLESSLISYEKLKFNSKEEAVHPLIVMSMAAMDMGWNFAVSNKHEQVQGLVVGTDEYLDEVFPKDKTEEE